MTFEKHAEHFEELEILNFDLDFKIWYRYELDIWTTQDKKKIDLTKMRSGHIKNAINLINSTRDIRVIHGLGKLWLPKLKRELTKRR